MQVVGLSARNVGDGKTIELTWSTPDPLKVRHFIVQRWNRHKRRWEPFDGFHGLVKHQTTEIDDNPPQRVLVEIDDVGPSQQTFRVKAVLLDGTETDWVTTSTQFITEGLRIGDSRIWYVREGLVVNRIDGRTLEVQPGSAVCAGVDRTVPRALSLALPDGAYNQTFYVWINAEGIIGLSSPADPSVMKLARVIIDASGSIASVEDLRFLWPPVDVSVQWSSILQRHAKLTWSTYREINLMGWRAYMSLDGGATWQRIGELEAVENSIDARIPDRYEGKVLFRVAALDYGDHESVPSLPVELDVTKSGGPSAPTGLRVTWGGPWSNPYVLLEWNQNPDEENVGRYNVYQLLDGRWLLVGATTHPHTRFTDRRLKGEVVTYAVSAVNVHGMEGPLSEPVTVVVGVTSPPKPPEWAPVDAITTGQEPDGTVWIRLQWQHVTERVDGSPIAPLSDTNPAGLWYYRIWHLQDGERFFAGEVPASQTEFVIRGVDKGVPLTYTVTALDGWMNESDPAVPQTIVAGDDRVPKPPVITRAQSVRADYSDWVELEWQAPTEDTKGRALPPDLIREYVILRGFSEIHLQEVGRTTGLSFQDTAVYRGHEYYYAVQVITKTNNVSDPSEPVMVVVGDFEPPPPPDWEDLYSTVEEDLTITNVIKWTWLDEEGNPTSPPADLRGVYIRMSSPPSGWQDIGYVPYVPDNEIREYRHSGVANGQLYKYALVSVDTSGNRSMASEIRTVIAGSTARPAAPDVTIQPRFEDGVAKLELKWSEVAVDEFGQPLVAPITGWRVYRSTTGMEFTLLSELPADAFTLTDANLLNGKRYWYRVAAVNALGVEGLPGEADGRAGDTVPPKPPQVSYSIALDPSSPSVGTVRLEIEPDPDDHDVAGFQVWASETGTKFFQVGYSSDGIFEETLPYGAYRIYRVSAVDEAGNVGTATFVELTVSDLTPPGAPQDVTLAFEAEPSMRFKGVLTWSYEPPADFAAYEIYQRVGGQDQLLATLTDPSTTSYVLPGLRGGQSYEFGVAVRDMFGNYSAIVYAAGTPADGTVPAPPENVVASGGPLRILVRWTEPAQNTDGSVLEDLKGYRIQGSADGFATIGFEAFTRSDHVFHETGHDGQIWRYRVRAEDIFGNVSDWAMSDYAAAQGIGGIDFDPTPPDPPMWADPAYSTGIDYSTSDEGKSSWVELFWEDDPNPDISGYQIEMSEDGTTWHQAAQASAHATHIKIGGLLSGVTLFFRLRAVGKLQSLSDPSTLIQVTTATDTAVPAVPASGYVIEGKGMLAIRWEPVQERRLSHYELEYQEKSPVGPWPGDWVGLAQTKATYFIHEELSYELVYRYRVRAVSLSGVASDWLVINPDGNQPRQTGQQDIAAGSIITQLLQVGIIEGAHIKAEAIEGVHVRSRTLSGQHLQAKSISAQEINVQAGGANWVKNSAFGMRDLQGNLGVDWQLSGASIVTSAKVSDIPIGDHCLELLSDEPAVIVAEQELSSALAGATVVFSAYAKWLNVADQGEGTGGFVELVVDEQPLASFRLVGGSGWTRFISDPVAVPPIVSSIKVRCRLQNTTGFVWITALKVEIGDVATAWVPYPGESYQAGGHVQINSEGIRITSGRLLIETDAGHVKITGAGLLAMASDGQQFASLTHQGLVIRNGMFEVSSPGNAFMIGPEGGSYSLRAYKGGKVTVRIGTDGNLVVNDGSFQIRTAESGSRIELDAQGIRAYNDLSYETFNLSSSGHLDLKGGRFTITTGNDANATGIVFDASGIRARNAQGETFRLNANNGSLQITGAFTIGPIAPKSTDAYLQITQERIYGQSGTGRYFELTNDGRALFVGGAVTIRSSTTDPNRQIVFDADGLYIGDKLNNPTFLLTQGFSDVEPGLYINDAKIRCGDVYINSTGIRISGDKGLVITTPGPEPEAIIEATSSGMRVLGGAGITVEGSGSIGFIPQGSTTPVTAVSAAGINAAAITTGILTIGTDRGQERPRIEVKDGDELKALIDSSGITVYDGALNVISPDGKVLIQNGQITASAINIGQAGGANLVRNGRADFGTEAWTFPGGIVTRVTEIVERGISAGVSGRYAFRFASLTANESMSQVLSGYDFGADVHTLVAWVYLHSGRLRVEIQNAAEPAQQELVTVGQWTKVVLRFVKGSGTPAVRFVNSAVSGIHTIAYITDVVAVKGVFEPGYIPHASEIFAEETQGGQPVGHVSISPSGIVVTGGKLDITTAGGRVQLNSTGLIGKDTAGNTIFSLTQNGLALSFPSQSITIDNSGIRAGSGSGYALLNSSGLNVVGGAVNIQGTGGQMRITNNLIEMTNPNNQHKVRLTPDKGLEITGGLFKLMAGSRANDNIYIGPYGVRIGPSENSPNISLGISPYSAGDQPDFLGLDIKNGRIRIRSEYTTTEANQVKEYELEMTDSYIEVRSKDAPRTFSRLSADRLIVGGADFESTALAFVDSGKITIEGGTKNVTFNRPFPGPPHVIAIPIKYITFNKNHSGNNQGIEINVSSVTSTGFTLTVSQLLDSRWRDGYTVSGSTYMGSDGTWIGRVPYNVMRLRLDIEISAPAVRHVLRVNIYTRPVGGSWTHRGSYSVKGPWLFGSSTERLSFVWDVGPSVQGHEIRVDTTRLHSGHARILSFGGYEMATVPMSLPCEVQWLAIERTTER